MEGFKTQKIIPMQAPASNTEPVPRLNIDAFRVEIQAIINEYAKVYDTPRDLITISAVAAAAAALGNRCKLDDGRHVNSPRLWIIIVGKSGGNKSDAIDSMFEPITNIDSNNGEYFKEKLADWKKNGCNGERPKREQLFSTSSTLEGIYRALNENPNGIVLLPDEVVTFFDGFGKYNSSKDEGANYMRLRDGKTVKINRKGEDPVTIPRPFLSVIANVQFSELGCLINRHMLGNGFAERMIYMIRRPFYPEHTGKSLSSFYKEGWNSVIQKLHKIPETRLKFSSEADKMYWEYYNKLQKLKYEADISGDDYTLSMFAKFQINVEELVSVLHFMCSNDGSNVYELPSSNEISVVELQTAIDWMDVFEDNFQEVLEFTQKAAKELSVMQSIQGVWHYMKSKGSNISIRKYADFLGVDHSNLAKQLKGK